MTQSLVTQYIATLAMLGSLIAVGFWGLVSLATKLLSRQPDILPAPDRSTERLTYQLYEELNQLED